jgi:hypothetical protein
MITNEIKHEFFLGFWTMIALLTAALYILVYCSERAVKMYEEFADNMNDKIDDMYGAIAQKLPFINNTPTIDV